jgi:hypothetical protein
MKTQKNTGKKKTKKKQLKLPLEQLEDYAFYESGLSADGCLNKLDDYALKAIAKYGRILLEGKDN